jgi:hypothetical protein
MTHVRTSPYYPQSNGKIERWHKSLKGECIRPRTPLSLEDARRLVEGYVEHYNNVRLNSAIGYITPTDMLAGRQQEIHAERDRKLEEARKQRQIHQIVDFVRRWSEKTEIGAGRFIEWLDITASKFYDWRERYGKVNEHNGWIPRDFWLEEWEKQAIIGFHLKNPLEGYRRLTFMMLDADIVTVSPSSVWRVLSHAGLLSKWNGKPSKKGSGFAQPLTAHEHWHIDVSYLNIGGTF